MMPSGCIQKSLLAIIQEAANERAVAFERATLFARNKDEAGAMAATGDRFLALASKLSSAICYSPVLLTLDDLERSIEALATVHRARARSTNRRAFQEVDNLWEKLRTYASGMEHEDH